MGMSNARDSGSDGFSLDRGEQRSRLLLELIFSLDSDSSSYGD
jgi:hypothetical protein